MVQKRTTKWCYLFIFMALFIFPNSIVVAFKLIKSKRSSELNEPHIVLMTEKYTSSMEFFPKMFIKSNIYL